MGVRRVVTRYAVVVLLVAFVVGYAIKAGIERTAQYEAVGFFQFNPGAQKVVEEAKKLGMDPIEYYMTYIAPKDHPELRMNLLHIGLRYMKASILELREEKDRTPTYRTLLLILLSELVITLTALFLAFKGIERPRVYSILQVTARTFNGIPVWFFVVLFFMAIIYSPLPSELVNGLKGTGASTLPYFVFPVLSVLLVGVWGLAEGMAVIMREEFSQPYVEAKRAMGLPEGRVRKGVLRAVAVPLMYLWLQHFVEVQTPVLVVDYLFNLGGLGQLLGRSLIITPDNVNFYPMTFTFVVTVLIVLNFSASIAAEVLSNIIEPREGP